MIEDDVGKPIWGQVKFFLIQMASTLITAVFLAVWLVVQYLVNLLLGMLEPMGVDQYVFLGFQGIFAVTTLIPIAVYYYVDIRIILMKAGARIRQEEAVSKQYGEAPDEAA